MFQETFPRVLPLAWDTAQFGMPVGRIAAANLTGAGLNALLQEARLEGFRLVYWETSTLQEVSDEVLGEFHGRLVDRKCSYYRMLDKSAAEEQPDRFTYKEYISMEPTKRLLELAVAAGQYSRFAVDPEMPPGLFESLYETWIRRSILREIADTVLVALAKDQGEMIGMITATVQGALAKIGLVAVDESARGLGLGLGLLRAARRWMLSRGAKEATVVTQAANLPACRLYEKDGYSLQHTRLCYHFWPQVGFRG